MEEIVPAGKSFLSQPLLHLAQNTRPSSGGVLDPTVHLPPECQEVTLALPTQFQFLIHEIMKYNHDCCFKPTSLGVDFCAAVGY